MTDNLTDMKQFARRKFEAHDKVENAELTEAMADLVAEFYQRGYRLNRITVTWKDGIEKFKVESSCTVL